MAAVYTDQRLNLSKLGKAFGRKPRFRTGPGKSGCPGLWGGFGKRKPWWDCEPVLRSKEQERKPLTYSGARPISIPVGPSVCNVSFNREGKDEMTKASIDLQDLRRRL